MLSDIEIAQQCSLLPIREVAEQAGIREEELEYYGRYKAKISDAAIHRLRDCPDGKLILVTAVNPTPAGEGKTTTTVGLGQAMARTGRRAVIALREPSLGPVFGIKGGAAGGGYAQVRAHGGYQPSLYRRYARHHLGQQPALRHDRQSFAAGQPSGYRSRAAFLFRRCLDMNDRALRHVVVGLGGEDERRAPRGQFSDHRGQRGYGHPLSGTRYGRFEGAAWPHPGRVRRRRQAGHCAASSARQGAMAALLRDALKPNLVQTHGGDARA